MLAVLWLVTKGVVQHHATGELTVFGTDKNWCQSAQKAVQEPTKPPVLPHLRNLVKR